MHLRNGLATALLLTLLAGCATAPASLQPLQPASDLQWPPRPAQARIEWVTAISSFRDVGIRESLWRRALSVFTGPDERRLVRPHGVLADTKGRLFIADPGAGVVHCLDLKEGRYRVIGGSEEEPLISPIGLALDGQDRLYISDSAAATVFVYDLPRKKLKSFLAGDLGRPTGIAWHPGNRLLYVVDTKMHQVIAVDLTGIERQRIGTPVDGGGGFNHPTDIRVDAEGDIFVIDPLNYRIHRFNSEGVALSQFGSPGDAAGHLNKPKGVATDSQGHVYVTDALLDAVQIFDGEGRLLLTFGAAGTGPGEFWMPAGIFIDDSDQIFVADAYNRRVQLFRYVAEEKTDARR